MFYQEFLPPQGSHIAVGISGGVDSSVSAALLLDMGYKVSGIFMKNWEEEANSGGFCTVAEDLDDAQEICDLLKIPLYKVNFAKQYQERVFAHFLEEYKAGRTPNPDVLCNREIKFNEMLFYAEELGADYLATGHYAKKMIGSNGEAALFCPKDKNKDQTYFLSQITKAQLAKAFFPLANLEKSEVRKIAEEKSLITFDKKDSTGICFIGERPFREFLKNYIEGSKGEIVNLEGEVLGKHEGLCYYTIGQRQGLNIGGRKNSNGEPYFVVEKDITTNRLIVCQGDNPALYHQEIEVIKLSWLNEEPIKNKKYLGKIRYRQNAEPCEVLEIKEDKLSLKFTNPQRAITLGQYLVLYDDDRCLGGGVIAMRN